MNEQSSWDWLCKCRIYHMQSTGNSFIPSDTIDSYCTSHPSHGVIEVKYQGRPSVLLTMQTLCKGWTVFIFKRYLTNSSACGSLTSFDTVSPLTSPGMPRCHATEQSPKQHLMSYGKHPPRRRIQMLNFSSEDSCICFGENSVQVKNVKGRRKYENTQGMNTVGSKGRTEEQQSCVCGIFRLWKDHQGKRQRQPLKCSGCSAWEIGPRPISHNAGLSIACLDTWTTVKMQGGVFF